MVVVVIIIPIILFGDGGSSVLVDQMKVMLLNTVSKRIAHRLKSIG